MNFEANTQKSVLMVPKYTNLYNLWNSKHIKKLRLNIIFMILHYKLHFKLKNLAF